MMMLTKCNVCGRKISKKYYVFGLDNNRKHIYAYYCKFDAREVKDWLQNPIASTHTLF